MGRSRRPDLPGAPFHLTAQIQWQQPLLTELQPRIVRLIHREAVAGDVRVVAYAVMSNHLHIVAIQGRRPLGWFMQSLLRRVALAVMRVHARNGHVFSRRYFARACLDPGYMRAVIAYVHLNPVRAGICAAPEAYEWSSHRAYMKAGPQHPLSAEDAECTDRSLPFQLTVESAIRLFAGCEERSLSACREDYRAYLGWRLALDAAEEQSRPRRSDEPRCAGGDLHWTRDFAPGIAEIARRRGQPAGRRPDLQEIALRVLRDHAPGMSLETVRGGGVTRPIVAARRLVIVHALTAGHRPAQIARYLRVAPSTVSLAAAPLRSGAAAPS